MLIIIIILILFFGVVGGYYTSQVYGTHVGGGIGLGAILLILLVCWALGLFR